MQTQTLPQKPDVNTLLAGAFLERQAAVESLNRRLDAEATLHSQRLAEDKRRREAEQQAREFAARKAVLRFRVLAREEARTQAPVIAEALLATLQQNVARGINAANLDPLGPLSPAYRSLLDKAGVLERSPLEDYRQQFKLETVGAIFHGSDVALVAIEFKVGHGNAPRRFPPWTQMEIHLAFRPDEYIKTAEPFGPYVMKGHNLNCGYTIDARIVRRY